MNRQGIVLKAFLVALPPEKREALVRHLPKERRNALSALPDISLEVEPSAQSPLNEVHWSWFTDAVKSYGENEQKLILKALNPRIQTPLCKAIGVSPIGDSITPIGAAFLRKMLESSIAIEALPKELLPPSPLNRLLKIEKKRLIELIDFLSLYDLFAEVRQIVDTKILNTIYSALTEEERKFLKFASRHKEPYPPTPLHLDSWDGTKQSLRKKLHKIGLARLGSALSGESEDLFWHLCHKLDVGRGEALAKLKTKKQMPGVSKWLSEQLKGF